MSEQLSKAIAEAYASLVKPLNPEVLSAIANISKGMSPSAPLMQTVQSLQAYFGSNDFLETISASKELTSQVAATINQLMSSNAIPSVDISTMMANLSKLSDSVLNAPSQKEYVELSQETVQTINDEFVHIPKEAFVESNNKTVKIKTSFFLAIFKFLIPLLVTIGCSESTSDDLYEFQQTYQQNEQITHQKLQSIDNSLQTLIQCFQEHEQPLPSIVADPLEEDFESPPGTSEDLQECENAPSPLPLDDLPAHEV